MVLADLYGKYIWYKEWHKRDGCAITLVVGRLLYSSIL
jgi:hypothetical protein